MRNWKLLGIFVVLSLINLIMFLPWISYIVGGFIIAYFLYPFYTAFPRWFPKRIAALFSIGIFTILTIVGTYLVFVQAYNEFIKYIPKMVEIVKTHTGKGLVSLELEIILRYISKAIPQIINFASQWIINIPNLLLGTFIAFVSAYYFLINGKEASDYILTLITDREDDKNSLKETVKAYLDAVILGQLFGSAAQAILSYLGFLILNIPLAALLSIIVFILAILPIVGPWVIWGTILLYMIFVKVNYALAIFTFIYGFMVVGLVDNVIRALLLSSKARLHPLIALISMLGGTAIMGFPGLFVGPVLSGVLLSLIAYYKEHGELSISKN